MYFPKPLQHDGHVPKEVVPMPLSSVALPCGIYRPGGGDKEFVLSCQGLATTPVPLHLTPRNERSPLSLTRSLRLHRVCGGRRTVNDGQQWGVWPVNIHSARWWTHIFCWKLGYSSPFSTDKAPYNCRWWALTWLNYELKSKEWTDNRWERTCMTQSQCLFQLSWLSRLCSYLLCSPHVFPLLVYIASSCTLCLPLFLLSSSLAFTVSTPFHTQNSPKIHRKFMENY